MEEEEDYEGDIKDIVPRPRRAVTLNSSVKDQMLADLATLVDNISGPDEEIEAKVVDTINKVVRDHSMRLKIFMVALTKRHMQNIFDLTQDLEELEEHLRSTSFDEMSHKEKLRMYSELQERYRTLIEMVMQVSEAGFPNQYEDPLSRDRAVEKVKQKGFEPLNPARRERVKNLAAKIRQQLKEPNG